VGAPAALRAAAEAGIDLAHPHLVRGVGKRRTHLLVAENVARTDDHDCVSGNLSIGTTNLGIVRANSDIGSRLKQTEAEQGHRTIPPRAF
jgi:hypothetical protein